MAITKKLPVLPIERALKAISGRWKAVILYHCSVVRSGYRN